MPKIPIEHVACNPPPPDLLEADWDDLLHAALTVGRPNRYYIFRYGEASAYEMMFRASMLRMALVSSPGNQRFNRTDLFKSLDPSEKGSINYFLGLTLCKLYATKQLGVPWLQHLDAAKDLNPELRKPGRSRPDMVGQRFDDTWVAFESKGRVAPADAKTKRKAKAQARRVVSVSGRPVIGHYAGISYFRNETLCFFIQDPAPLKEGDAGAISVKGEKRRFFETYYAPFLEFISQDSRHIAAEVGVSPDYPADIKLANSREMDAEIGMRSDIFGLAANKQWEKLTEVCSKDNEALIRAGYHSDGIFIKCGSTWQKHDKRSLSKKVGDG